MRFAAATTCWGFATWLVAAIPQTPAPAAKPGKDLPAPTFQSAWTLTLDLKDPFIDVSANAVFLTSKTGPLSALAFDDGRAIWKLELSSPVAPVAGEDVVFVSDERSVRAIAQTNGQERWRATTGPPVVRPLFRAGWLFVADGNGNISALRSTDGTQVWKQALGSPASAPLAIDGDVLFVPLLDGRLVALAVNAEGRSIWTCTLDAAAGMPLAADERVYIGSAKGVFYSIKQKTGRIDWRHTRLGNTVVGHPVLSDSRVFIATLDKRVIAFDRGGGAQLWWEALAANPAEQLQVDRGYLVAALTSGDVLVLQEKTGKSTVAIPAPKSTGARLAAPVVIGGTAEARRLVRVVLGSDAVLTMESFSVKSP